MQPPPASRLSLNFDVLFDHADPFIFGDEKDQTEWEKSIEEFRRIVAEFEKDAPDLRHDVIAPVMPNIRLPNFKSYEVLAPKKPALTDQQKARIKLWIISHENNPYPKKELVQRWSKQFGVPVRTIRTFIYNHAKRDIWR